MMEDNIYTVRRSVMQKRVEFSSFDGTKLNGVLASNGSARPKGGVLLLHGIPADKDEDGFYSEPPNPNDKHKKLGGMVEYLTSEGFLSLRFDYREQGENAKTPNMDNLSVSGMVADTDSGYRVLKNNLPDDTPIYVVGTSFAGGIAVKWLSSYNSRIDLLLLMAPLLDFPTTIRKTNVLEVDQLGMERLKKDAVEVLNSQGYLLSGGKKMKREFLNEVMMMNLEQDFARLSCKSVIFHGTLDAVVPYQASVDFVALSSGMSELVTVRDADHGFSEEGDFEWETDQSKLNQETVYREMMKRMQA